MNTRKSSIHPGTILLVSSDQSSAAYLTEVLHTHGHCLRRIGSGESSLEEMVKDHTAELSLSNEWLQKEILKHR